MRTRFDPDELAAHADAVRALAARIVADASAADDVVQDACVAALERPPRADVPRRAWFVSVVRNLALRSRRDAARRDRRDRVVPAPPPAPPAADIAERIEGHRRLVDAVAALDEPYRTAIVLRFFEGLAPPEIAARLGVPVGTVHTHVHRGVARLRARLAPEDDDGRGRHMLLVLAAPPGGGTAPPGTPLAPRPGAPPMLAPPPLVPLAGVLAMAANKTVAACAVLLLALLVGAVAVHERRAAERGTAAARIETTSPATHGAARATAAAPLAVDDLPPPVDLAAIDRDLDLHGRVVDDTGAAVAGAEVSTFTRPWARTRAMVVEARSEEVAGPGTRSAVDGTFRIRLARGARADLRVRRAGFAETVQPWCQAGERVEVVLRPGVAVVVSVTDTAGAAVSGAEVWLLRGEEGAPGGPRLDASGTTSGDGVCRLDGLPPGVPGAMLQVTSERGTFWDPAVATPKAGESRLDIRLRTTRRVRGVVTDADTRTPIAGAKVSESWTLRGAVTSDAQGAYELPATEDSFQVCAQAPGFAEAIARIGASDRVDISLRRATRVVGRAVGADGRPVAGVRIAVCGAEGADGGRTNAQGVAGDDGRFEIAGVRATESFVLVLLAPGHGRTLLDVDAVGTPGGLCDLGDVPLAPSRRISGRVVLPDGAPCPNAIVKLSGANADRSRLRPEAGPGTDASYGEDETARTDDLGRFAFADQAPGDYGLQAVLAGRKNASASVEVGAADADGVELRFVGGHRLVARIVDEEGGPVGAAPVTAWTEDRWSLSFVAGATAA